MRTSIGEGFFIPHCVPLSEWGKERGLLVAVVLRCDNILPIPFDQCVGRVLYEFFKERYIHINIFRVCRDNDFKSATQPRTGTGNHTGIVFQVAALLNLYPLTEEVE